MKINIVKTDKICYISDCNSLPGNYDYNYHRSQLTDMLFDGEKPKETYLKNWLQIKKYPTKMQKYVNRPDINKRYELKSIDLQSDKLPLVIKYEDKEKYDGSVIESLYEFKSDKQEPVLEDVECEFNVLFEIENYEFPPVIDYKVTDNKKNKITNVDVKHQLFDKMIFPEIMLSSRPCSISSKYFYDIIRQYVIKNIDTKVARITSNYDFCFTVKKVIPLIELERVTYQKYFARTKKERSKIHYAIKETKEVEIFEMTHDQENHQSYTVMSGITAENEHKLKEKIDIFLSDLMATINKPLKLCPHCNGSGYEEQV